ncbi:MAG: hypothetical protein QM722_02440 [Piscinibacter sp.]
MSEMAFSVRAAVRHHTDALLAYPNVVAVGAARKIRKGRPVDTHAVAVYVSRKLPAAMLEPRQRIPSHLETDDASVVSDVVQIGEPRLLAVDTAQYRPLRGGCQIQSSSGTGTLGGILYDRLDHRPVLLTNNHVLTPAGAPTFLPSDTRIFQPAGGPQVGSAKRIVPMFLAPLGEFGYRFGARVDAGIVAPLPGIDLDFSVVELGKHPYVVLPPYEGLAVEHRGFRTQLRTGTVEALDLTVILKASNGDRIRIGGGSSVFSIRAPERFIGAWPGDSGSLVVDAAHGSARGLVFGGDGLSGGLTYACELGAVMQELQLETACTGELSALVRRSVFRRLTTAWAAAEHGTDGGARHANALVEAMVEKVDRFRDRHLADAQDGRVAGAFGTMLHQLASELAEGAHDDEDFAGLLDQAFGDWLVLPTVYDMLEYRIPEQLGPTAIAAFRRLGRRTHKRSERHDLGWFESALSRSCGLTMREWIALRAEAPPVERPKKKRRKG